MDKVSDMELVQMGAEKRVSRPRRKRRLDERKIFRW